MFTAKIIEPTGFRFSQFDESATHADKMRGISKFGPYTKLSIDPKVGFVFPDGAKEYANKLFLALRNGIGYFKGTSSIFGYSIKKENVFAITDFKVENTFDHESAAEKYREAICAWIDSNSDIPDLFIILHSKSLGWEDDSPYASSKGALLERGIVSQNVTFELMDNPSNFEWSAANIALNIFVKFGGVPWVSNTSANDGALVIGMGRGGTRDPVTRELTQYMAFTTCFRTDGLYKFSVQGEIADTYEVYLKSLRETLVAAINRAQEEGTPITSLTIHMPKEYSKEEARVVENAIGENLDSESCQLSLLKISEEDRFFAFDDSQYGIVKRGTCIKLGAKEYLLYTEGSDEKSAWRSRLPTALRIKLHRVPDQSSNLFSITQVLDLSLMNWRGFNAKALPISIFYSQLIAKSLSSVSLRSGKTLRLPDTPWFL